MKKYFIISSLLGMLAIILGAFGAHLLETILTKSQLTSFETAVRYQIYHVLAILFVNNMSLFDEKIISRISNLFLGGILLFSGSIYAITFGVETKYIWFLTPLGGLLFISGWFFITYNFIKLKNKNDVT